ncbi:diphosphomevalonate decarboxylase [Nocardia colli]|uniref:diphosphomevalonate decarboxylase n=1 Tax=Nocardia colli TaxID=2545717 RepID=UPI0035E0A4BA
MTAAATAVAYPNIALVKYWGKRDEEYRLPMTGSISLTLDLFPTTTTVTVTPGATIDAVRIDDAPPSRPATQRVQQFLGLVRALAGRREHATVQTTNSGPTAAGLASSAAGFAALAVAAAAAYELELDPIALSRLARRGSGSACRSVFGGFTCWRAGAGLGPDGDATSYAEPLSRGTLDPAMVVAIVDATPKPISSTVAMRHTVATSPCYWAWSASCLQDLIEMRKALADGELVTVGEIAERNALGMHAAMLAARPAVRFLTPASLAVLDRVAKLRVDGIAAYATIDAGPNVKVLCEAATADVVAAGLRAVETVQSVHIGRPGPAPTLRRLR